MSPLESLDDVLAVEILPRLPRAVLISVSFPLEKVLHSPTRTNALVNDPLHNKAFTIFHLNLSLSSPMLPDPLEIFDELLAAEVLFWLPGAVLISVALPLQKILDLSILGNSLVNGFFNRIVFLTTNDF